MRFLQTVSAKSFPSTRHCDYTRGSGRGMLSNELTQNHSLMQLRLWFHRRNALQLPPIRTHCSYGFRELFKEKQIVVNASQNTTKFFVFMSATLSWPDNCAAVEMGAQNVSWQIYAGFIASLVPFIIGASEFTKRILIQRRCKTCQGSGLLQMKEGSFIKCTSCGGFFPWQSWERFFISNTDPGNGGILRQPKGQTSVFYKVPSIPKESSDDANPVSQEE